MSRVWRKMPGRAAVCVLLLALVFAYPARVLASAAGSDASGAEDTSGAASQAAAAEPDEAEGGKLFDPGFEPQAAGVCLVSEDTGLVVYEKNADEPLVSASVVKMMTCILTMECVQRYGGTLDSELVSSAGKTWIYDELYGKNASTADIRKGETLSVRELLYAALLPSANEAALLLADYVGAGYLDNFMYQMNTKAELLGCTGTVFADPNGLSEENVTTARDMVLIALAFFSWPELVEIAATPTYEMAAHEMHAAPYYIHTTNRLLVKSSPYHNAFKRTAGCVVAGKTGSLGEWQNFVSMAEKDGMQYICAVLNSPNAADPIGAELQPAQARPALYETAALYDWAFTALEVRAALDTDEAVKEIRVRYSSKQDTVRLLPDGDIKALLPVEAKNTELKRYYELPEYLEAPVQAGAVVGKVVLTLEGQTVGEANLMAAQDVERNNTLYLLERAGQALSSLYLRVLIIVVVVAAVLYAGLVALLHRRREKKRRQAAARAAAGAQRPAPPEKQARPPQNAGNKRTKGR
ncbi:MAG: D-alanyl-D-alanine carboxypeptidase family protein [Oscillospiraceae bacterium]